jgi:hypothetical protein
MPIVEGGNYYESNKHTIWVHEVGKTNKHANKHTYIDECSKEEYVCITTMLHILGYDRSAYNADTWSQYRIDVDGILYDLYILNIFTYRFGQYGSYRDLKDNKELYEFIYKWRDNDRESEDRSPKAKQISDSTA